MLHIEGLFLILRVFFPSLEEVGGTLRRTSLVVHGIPRTAAPASFLYSSEKGIPPPFFSHSDNDVSPYRFEERQPLKSFFLRF